MGHLKWVCFFNSSCVNIYVNTKRSLYILLGCLTFSAEAKTYLTEEQAQKQAFPGLGLTKTPTTVTAEQQAKMTDVSSVSQPFDGKSIWKAADGGWFIIDQVVGKHEFITYSVAINPDGTVKLVEIMEYNESYGYEVKETSWLQQFIGKTASSPIKLNKDIQGISGATLSSKHLADGVKRVMTFYDLALKTH